MSKQSSISEQKKKKLHIQQTGDITFCVVYEDETGQWIPLTPLNLTLREAEDNLRVAIS